MYLRIQRSKIATMCVNRWHPFSSRRHLCC
jgi:hypothetical protein